MKSDPAIKIDLDERQDNNGTYPVQLRVTYNDQPRNNEIKMYLPEIQYKEFYGSVGPYDYDLSNFYQLVSHKVTFRVMSVSIIGNLQSVNTFSNTFWKLIMPTQNQNAYHHKSVITYFPSYQKHITFCCRFFFHRQQII